MGYENFTPLIWKLHMHSNVFPIPSNNTTIPDQPVCHNYCKIVIALLTRLNPIDTLFLLSTRVSSGVFCATFWLFPSSDALGRHTSDTLARPSDSKLIYAGFSLSWRVCRISSLSCKDKFCALFCTVLCLKWLYGKCIDPFLFFFLIISE